MAFMVPIIMRQQPGNVAPGIQHAIMVVMITVMTVLRVMLPAIFLFFYSRKSVQGNVPRSRKGRKSERPWREKLPPGLPVPLAILGVWQALGAFSVFAILFMRVTFVFGVVLHGAAAVLVLLTYSVLCGYAAWAIFRQKLHRLANCAVFHGLWDDQHAGYLPPPS